MTATYRKMIFTILLLAGVGAGCSRTEPFAFRCKTSDGAEAGSYDLFVVDPAAAKIYRQIANGWEPGVPVEITRDRIFGRILPTSVQVGSRYDFDRTAGTGERFIGHSNSRLGVGLRWQYEDCTSLPVPQGAPPQNQTAKS